MYQLVEKCEAPTMLAMQTESLVEEGKLFPSEAVENGFGRQYLWVRYLFMTLLAIVIVGLLLMYAVFPIAFYTSSWLRRTLVFEAYKSREDLSDPSRFGLNCSKNFYINSQPESIRIGAWYIASGEGPCPRLMSQPMFSGDAPVILFMHGIMANRGRNHRAQLAQRLANEAGAHVVAIDYRGFGDSTYVMPSLSDETTDALAAYDTIRKSVPPTRIVLWGHSMGTAVTMRVAAELHRRNETPAAIVLESAFDNIGHVTSYSTLAKFWYWLPGLDTIFTQALTDDPATAADSSQQAYLISPSVPVLMLHSEDDCKTPLKVSDSLRMHIVHSRMDSGEAGPVKSVIFSKEHQLGHNWLAKYPQIPQIVRQFLEKQTVGDNVLDQIVL